ncbi:MULTISPECIES: type 2 lanthipeptide synthetase LanM family protein [unclassified Corallococcus]|uniref:type 2 lanthipeptide synthetase LanM family protein n=1 Tax=unclassified Corallococcus TaxID=2685029 RepID=UPI001A9069B6|nr:MULTISPECIES: type 2 lanthipeptide synthetase LanM family protein [unclassified Corallococcus]MBN9683450.1 type 2 lantipeptide synthetase LanM family protein [Corallococcus sp. NCSPR001]WAS85032.1 type 2 lanthipeptide synthetase LanM family protein [Corallococcus sp. NCRR]
MKEGSKMGAWEKAAFLHEREATEEGPSAPAIQKAESRLQAWRRSTLGDEASFDERLRSVGLDAASFVRRLASSTPRPEALTWLPLLEEVLSDGAADVALPSSVDPGPRMRVSSLTRRFLQLGLRRLRAGVDALSARTGLAADALLDARAEAWLVDALEQRLMQTATRSLVLELNVARLRGELQGETPQARFEHFALHHLETPGRLAAFLEEYPVLARLLVTSLERWIQTSLELLTHLAEDRESLVAVLGAGVDPGPLVEARTGAGDSHREGRSVALLTFRSGLRVVYKPRSLEIEARYQDLLEQLERWGLRHPHRRLKVLTRATHGWVEHVETGGCDDRDAVARFYWRQGSQLALLYLLRGVDLHSGNLLAAGEFPVLVDLEGLFHQLPPPRADDTAASRAARFLERSVISSGLLPTLMFGREGRAGVELSGLGGEAGQLFPHAAPMLEDRARDTLHVVRKQPATAGAHNRPLLEGRPVDVTEFGPCIEEGFQETYGLLLQHRGEVARRLEGFRDVEVRHIARATMRYGFLLQEGLHPDFLRDALDRDQLLDKLWAEVRVRPALARLTPSEHEDLRLGDVPVFTARPGSRHVWDSRGLCIPDHLPSAGLEGSRQLLADMGPEDCADQVALIRQSLVTLEREREPVAPRVSGSAGDALPPPATPEACLAGAIQLGELLAARAIHGAHDVGWIGVGLQDLERRRWGLSPLRTDLFDGVGGVALFLGYLAAVTGREDFAVLARRAAVPVREQWRAPESQDPSGVGAFAGRAANVYVLGHLAVALDDTELLDEVHAGLASLEAKIDADTALDLVAGVAGTALVLMRLHQQTGSAEALRLARKCGERMLQTASDTGHGGRAWVVPAAGRALTGLAHGAAGLVWALLELATLTGDERYREAARQGLAFERALFVPERGNWKDLRTSKEGEPLVPGGFMTAWCNGAAGGVLARLLSLRHLDDSRLRDEVVAGLATVQREGFGGSHCLCHGDVGNLEVLHLAGEVLGDGAWKEAARSRAARVLAQGQDGVWRCGLPRFTEAPGLMLGLAGIGMGLLRLAAPDFVPSVLSLQAPRPLPPRQVMFSPLPR